MNTQDERTRLDPILNRQLFSIHLPSAVPLPLNDLPPKHFVCMLAWDARGTSAQAIADFVDPLLHAGASYFVCWGPDCERVHDIIDQVTTHPDNDFDIPEDSVIMTTWHPGEPLREALFTFLAAPYRTSTM
jgi:hypothetical protein